MLEKLLIGGCILGGACISASAQSQDPVSLGYFHKFAGDVDNGGSVSVDRWNVRGGVVLHKSDAMLAVLTAGYSLDKYDFDTVFNPWGEVRLANVGMPIRWKYSDQWTLAAIPRIGLSAENGADLGESINWSVVTSLDYKVSDTLTIGPGFSYVDQLEDDASLFPILSIKWQINEKWSLKTGPSEGASSGANVFLSYKQNDRWSYSTGVYFHESRFRLSENSVFSASGVGEESFIGAYGIVKFRPSEHLSYSLIAGYAFSNEYNVYDSLGNTVTERDADATPFAGLRVSYEF